MDADDKKQKKSNSLKLNNDDISSFSGWTTSELTSKISSLLENCSLEENDTIDNSSTTVSNSEKEQSSSEDENESQILNKNPLGECSEDEVVESDDGSDTSTQSITLSSLPPRSSIIVHEVNLLNGDIDENSPRIEEDIEEYEDEVDDVIAANLASALTPTNKKVAPLNYGCRVFGGAGLDKSGWHVIRGAESEQYFIRAPNFRTPGGYKPPLVEKEPRELSQEQLLEELKIMYSETNLEEDNYNSTQLTTNSTSTNSTSTNDTSNSDENKDLNIGTDRTAISEESERSAEIEKADPVIKPKKRISFHSDIEVMSSAPQMIFNNNEPVNDTSLVPDYNFNGDISRCLPRNFKISSSKEKQRKSLEELGKIWNEIQMTKKGLESEVASTSSLINSQKLPKKDLISSSSISQTKIQNSAPTKDKIKNSSTSSSVPLKKAPSLGKRPHEPIKASPPSNSPQIQKLKVKKKTKLRSKKTPLNKEVLTVDSTPQNSLENGFLLGKVENNSLDDSLNNFEEILETHILDLDELLNDLNLRDELSVPILPNNISSSTNIFNENGGDEFEESSSDFDSALQQLQISDWAKEGASEYMQKYIEERYKREACESQVMSLSSQLLLLNEKVSVLEGNLAQKEVLVTKFTTLWDKICKKWAAHEKGCKTRILNLNSSNGELKKEVEGLKSSLKRIENEKLGLEEGLEGLKNIVQETKAEKEESEKSLRDCTTRLDETLNLLRETSEEMSKMKSQLNSQSTTLALLQSQNEELRTQVQKLNNDKFELESNLNHLQQEMIFLESAHMTKLNETRAKLHAYYNSKIKDILELESQKVMEAEREFMKSYEEKLQNIEEEASKKSTQMCLNFSKLLNELQINHLSHVSELTRENDDKMSLISKVTNHLLSFTAERTTGLRNDEHFLTTQTQEKNLEDVNNSSQVLAISNYSSLSNIQNSDLKLEDVKNFLSEFLS